MALSTPLDVVPAAVPKVRSNTPLWFLVASALLTVSCTDQSDASEVEGALEWVEQALEDDDPPPPVDGGVGVVTDAGSSTPLDGGVVVQDAGVRRDAGRSDGGGVIGPDGGLFGPLVQWTFDDCSTSPILADSSGRGVNATKSPSVQCAEGVSGSAVSFDERRDSIEAAGLDATLSTGLSVALWVNPSSSRGTLIHKGAGSNVVFSLGLERSRAHFSLSLRSGNRTRTVSTSIPVTSNRWTHLAGVYDGEFVRLFRDGRQVGQVFASGQLVDGAGPVRLGGDALVAKLDEVAIFQRALPEFEVANLSCISRPLTLAVTPTSIGPVEPEVDATYDIAVTNQNSGSCGNNQFLVFSSPPPGINVQNGFQVLTIEPGQTGHATLTARASSDADPGSHEIPLQVFASFGSEPVFGSVQLIVAEPSGCFVRTGRELLIRDLSVVEDPVRAGAPGSEASGSNGVWSFDWLMRQMAPTEAEAPAMVERMFRTWLSEQTINTFSVPARASMRDLVIDGWPRTPEGQFDLTRAPLRLLAIVNRIDVRNLDKGHAGEGRFVFGVQGPGGFPLEFTIILEYRLPATTNEDVLAWANAWHELSALPFPSEQYNAALEVITRRFAGRGAEPGRPNGSALGQLRTNEIALAGPWELREFRLSAETGMLEPAPVELTPDTSFMANSSLIADYINENEAAILIERHEVPASFRGTPFLGGSSFNDLFGWNADGIVNPEARFRFSLNTCNGCHAGDETNTAFLHVFNRGPGEVAQLSSFMQGTTVFDPFSGEARTLNDLGRRNADLKALVCGGVASTVTTPLAGAAPQRPTPAPSATARDRFVRRGIGRVH